MKTDKKWITIWLSGLLKPTRDDWNNWVSLFEGFFDQNNIAITHYDCCIYDKKSSGKYKKYSNIVKNKIKNAIEYGSITSLFLINVPDSHITIIQDTYVLMSLELKGNKLCIVIESQISFLSKKRLDELYESISRSLNGFRKIVYYTSADGLPMNILINYDDTPEFINNFKEVYQIDECKIIKI